ncbi:hypothetical protein [Luteolibacter sp.]
MSPYELHTWIEDKVQWFRKFVLIAVIEPNGDNKDDGGKLTEAATKVFRKFVADSLTAYGEKTPEFIDRWIDRKAERPWDMKEALEEFFVGLTQEGGSHE